MATWPISHTFLPATSIYFSSLSLFSDYPSTQQRTIKLQRKGAKVPFFNSTVATQGMCCNIEKKRKKNEKWLRYG